MDMWAFNLEAFPFVLPSDFLPKTEVARQIHFYDYEELLNSSLGVISHRYSFAANTVTYLCCVSAINPVSISLLPPSVNSTASTQQRRSTLPRGLASATSSLFSSSMVSHRKRQRGVALVGEAPIEFKNASVRQDVIRIIKRLPGSRGCDVLMKLVFDLKISQEA